MQDVPRLNLYQNEYCPSKQCYYLSEALAPKLPPSHIKSQEDAAEEGKKGKKRKLIFPQEMLYLTYLAEFSQSANLNSPTARKDWQALKRQDVLTILTNLSEKGYCKFEFLQFYLAVRKKSKLIERTPIVGLQGFPFYKIYKTVDDFKQKQKGETFYLVQKDEKIQNILKARRNYEGNGPLKIHILSNMDGVVIISKPCFTLTIA